MSFLALFSRKYQACISVLMVMAIGMASVFSPLATTVSAKSLDDLLLAGNLPSMMELPNQGSGAPQMQNQIIRSIEVDAEKQMVRIAGFDDSPASGSFQQKFSILKLPNPYRVIIDIPNAELQMARNVIPVHKNGIQELRLEENKTPYFQSVRLTVFLDNSETLWKFNTYQERDELVLVTDAPPAAKTAAAQGEYTKPVVQMPQASNVPAYQPSQQSQTVFNQPVALGTNVIQEIFYRDDALYIKAAGSGQVAFKNRFTLSNPSRLVIDLDHAVLSSKNLTRPISVNSADVRQIRVGQFDEETVRVVLETARPETVQVIYPTEYKNLALISPNLGSSIETLPSEVQLGQIQDIAMGRTNGITTIKLDTSEKMVYRLHKDNDKLYVDLLNVAGKTGSIQHDKNLFPEVDVLKVEPLTVGQPNSKLVIDLKDASVDVSSAISTDGKSLKLMLHDFSKTTPMVAGYNEKAPYKARIVVDAGHGGKDDGASRSGVKEKDLNLNLALMLKKDLEARGFQVYMTRDTDKFLPLPTITAITNKIKPDLFISVHHNASVNPSLHGYETYYYTAQSKALASKVHRRVVNNVHTTDRGVRKAMFYVIHHTPVPAILCEVGYVSNAGELNQLVTRNRQSRTVSAIGQGVVDYLKSRTTANAKL